MIPSERVIGKLIERTSMTTTLDPENLYERANNIYEQARNDKKKMLALMKVACNLAEQALEIFGRKRNKAGVEKCNKFLDDVEAMIKRLS